MDGLTTGIEGHRRNRSSREFIRGKPPGMVRVAFISLALVGCASTTSTTSLDPRTLDAMRGGTKVELHVDQGGKVTKVEVYQIGPGQTPEAIRKMAEEQLKGGQIKAYEYEVLADGSEVFEIEATMPDGLTCEVSGGRDGKLAYKECQLAIDKAPDAIKKAALGVIDGEIVEVEHKQGPGLDEYSVEIRHGAELHKVKLTATGQVIAHLRKVPAEIVVPAKG
jgi:hypothetical protein